MTKRVYKRRLYDCKVYEDKQIEILGYVIVPNSVTKYRVKYLCCSNNGIVSHAAMRKRLRGELLTNTCKHCSAKKLGHYNRKPPRRKGPHTFLTMPQPKSLVGVPFYG